MPTVVTDTALDTALETVLGSPLYVALRDTSNTGRTGIMRVAIERMWMEQRPEDCHSAIIRQAMANLAAFGKITGGN